MGRPFASFATASPLQVSQQPDTTVLFTLSIVAPHGETTLLGIFTKPGSG